MPRNYYLKIDYYLLYINIIIISRKTPNCIAMNKLIKFMLLFSMFTTSSQSFPVYKVVRVNYKIMKRHATKTIVPRINTFAEGDYKIIEKSVSILSDNAINEMLYMLKFYHITNDASSSFVYIFTYEFIWVIYQLHKKNLLSGNMIDMSNENSQQLLKQVILNVTLYILLKNVVINNVLSEINKDYIS